MTTITKEWLQQTIAEFENTRDDIPFGLDDDDAKILIVLKRALSVIDAEPVRYLNKFSGTCVTLEQQSNAADDVAVYIPLYAAPPVQETGVYNDVLNIIGLLENNEWAEHCASTVLGSLLESEITRLVGKEQPAPVVTEEMPKGLAGQIVSLLAHNIGDKFLAQKIWNACRSAILQAGNHTEQHLEMVDHSGDANEKGSDGTFIDEGTKQAGNSPVTPIHPQRGLTTGVKPQMKSAL
ncbi:hypothetical protein ZM36_004144 [Salmonella enterica subsp. diarizonae]|nr:hypothetical protein [Salmonella enterica subsp. diarizonae]EDY3377227.1 hypothetical protein [Salmonella enterica]EEM9509691.1 hypothetical protein [Salmonella enterica]ELF3919289.1 hypothetical protein [Salmonella enterica]